MPARDASSPANLPRRRGLLGVLAVVGAGTSVVEVVGVTVGDDHLAQLDVGFEVEPRRWLKGV